VGVNTLRTVIVILLLAMSAYTPTLTWAAGPEKLATSPRSNWPFLIKQRTEFDTASRAEILVFVEGLNRISKYNTESEWSSWLNVKRPNLKSINTWREKTKQLVLVNFQAASQICASNTMLFCPGEPVTDWKLLTRFTDSMLSQLPPDLTNWLTAQRNFHELYLYEQFRLAALFPVTTSEILALGKNEVMGDDMEDLSFLLTFDDGPTASNGETDETIHTLRSLGVNGIFFLLGERLDVRLNSTAPASLKNLYQGMCVAAHGAKHVSHAHWDQWQFSIDQTKSTIEKILPAGQTQVSYFRPPYGQRTITLTEYLSSHDMTDMLWNIDSQDWNQHISSKEITDRLTTLMLLWRHGILLFHDVHPKARESIPPLIDSMKNAGIRWLDCHDLKVVAAPTH
jgi:peptidoglycan/xylan/chitin deacetylase (PgdA/CDA1 family)